MPIFDWPLTVFTLIAQLVLGAFAVLWVTDLLARQLADAREQEHLTSIAVWILGPLMAIGFAASTLHLGQPLFAWRALNNLGSSWLSREILFLSAFFGLGGLYAGLWWRYRQWFALRAVVGAVAGVAGALGLASMTALYMLPAMPSWSGLPTPMAFVGSALLLGPLLVAAVFLATSRRHERTQELDLLLRLHLKAMAGTVAAGAVLVAGAVVLNVRRLGRLGLEGEASLALLLGDHRGLVVTRGITWLLGMAAVALLVALLLREASVDRARVVVWSMFATFAASELIGRLLFYGTAVPWRPPGPFA